MSGRTVLPAAVCVGMLFLQIDVFSVSGLSSQTSFSPQSYDAPKRRRRRHCSFPYSKGVSPDDVQVLIRQTGQSSPGVAAIGIPQNCQCRHGMAQVFALDPFPSQKRINSGLLKLTCPLLVRAVDQLEDEGYITQFNSKVAQASSSNTMNENGETMLQQSMRTAHQVHASVRKELIPSVEERGVILEKIGERGADAFWNAGVAGASADAVSDVKCLHAWLGDYLFRGSEASPIGVMVAKILLERGIDLSGTPDCFRNCDPSSSLAVEPPIPRNKQRRKSSKELARKRRQKDSIGSDNTTQRNCCQYL